MVTQGKQRQKSVKTLHAGKRAKVNEGENCIEQRQQTGYDMECQINQEEPNPMAVNYVLDQENPLKLISGPQRSIEAKDLVIINRQQFVALWREWEKNERKLYDAVSGLAHELLQKVERSSPASDARRAMLDLLFSNQEQHDLEIAWETEEKEQWEKLKEANVKEAIEAFKKLSNYQRSTVLAETDEIERREFLSRRGIHDLVPRLQDDDAEEIYRVIKRKLRLED